MSTLILENIKHPDASGNALELSADGNLTSPNYLFATGGANFGSTIDTAGIYNTGNVVSTGTLAVGVSVPDSTFHVRNGSGNCDSIVAQYGTGTKAKISAYSDSADLRAYNGANRLTLSRPDGNNSLVIDTNGSISLPYQPHWAGSVGHSSGAGTSAVANQVNERNSRGGITWSGDRWTVPITGVYAISFQTICANTSGRKDTFLKVNGATWNSCLNEDNGSGFHQRTHVANIYLQASDYIQVQSDSWYNTSSATEVWQTVTITLLG